MLKNKKLENEAHETDMYDNLNVNVFCEHLIKARKDNRLTQKSLAEKTGLATSTISGYESLFSSVMGKDWARKTPSIYTAYKLARALNISLDWLCGLSEHQNKNNAMVQYDDVTMLHMIAELIDNDNETWIILKNTIEMQEFDDRNPEYGKSCEVAIGTQNIHFKHFIIDYEKAVLAAQNAVEVYGLSVDDAKRMKTAMLNKHIEILSSIKRGVINV
jgi:transcriptional regulator with XRE-family HTH domain